LKKTQQHDKSIDNSDLLYLTAF